MVASDFSEPPESSQMERLEEIAEEVLPQGLLEVGSGKLGEGEEEEEKKK